MFYRVRANYPFLDEDEANDFAHDCQVAYSKASIINPGQWNEIRPSYIFEICHHDEEPSEPCTPIDQLPVPD